MLEIMEINSLNILLPENVSPQLINSTNVIVDAIKELGNQSFIIGNELVKIRDSKSYLPIYKSITDYGEQVFGFKKSAIYSFMKIADLFLNEQGEIDSPQMQGMNFSQLESLTSLKENEINELFSEGIIDSNTSTKEIKNAVKNYKERKKAIKALTDKGFSKESAEKTIDSITAAATATATDTATDTATATATDIDSNVNQSGYSENIESEVNSKKEINLNKEFENELVNLVGIGFSDKGILFAFEGENRSILSSELSNDDYKHLLTTIIVKLQKIRDGINGD